MEDALTWLRERAKTHKREFLAPFVLALAGILIFFGLTSDIGFSNEITKHRYKVLIFSTVVAGMYALINLNRILYHENQMLARDSAELNSSLETSRQEREGFSNLVKQKEKEIWQLRETVLNLYRELTGGRICEVYKVRYFKERLHLSIVREADKDSTRGDVVRVIDTTDGDIMGVFEVTEVSETSFEAKSTHYVNPLWLGYILQSRAESTLPPDTVAILFPKEGVKDE